MALPSYGQQYFTKAAVSGGLRTMLERPSSPIIRVTCARWTPDAILSECLSGHLAPFLQPLGPDLQYGHFGLAACTAAAKSAGMYSLPAICDII